MALVSFNKITLMKRIIWNSFSFMAVALLIASCGKEKSSVTGWNYNDPKNGGFEVVPYDEQETGPGLGSHRGWYFHYGKN